MDDKFIAERTMTFLRNYRICHSSLKTVDSSKYSGPWYSKPVKKRCS